LPKLLVFQPENKLTFKCRKDEMDSVTVVLRLGHHHTIRHQNLWFSRVSRVRFSGVSFSGVKLSDVAVWLIWAV